MAKLWQDACESVIIVRNLAIEVDVIASAIAASFASSGLKV